MKDATHGARLERAIATLEIILGRLERLTGPFQAGAPNLPESPATPPIDEEAQKLADAYIERRRDELLEHEMAEAEDG